MSSLKYARLVLRVIATAIDIIVIFIALEFLIAILPKEFLDVAQISLNIRKVNLVYTNSFLILYILYQSIMESSKFQGGLGKIIMRLKVTDVNGSRLSDGRSLMRNTSKVLANTFFTGIPFLFAFFTKKKQALHDLYVPGTVAGGTLVLEPSNSIYIPSFPSSTVFKTTLNKLVNLAPRFVAGLIDAIILIWLIRFIIIHESFSDPAGQVYVMIEALLLNLLTAGALILGYALYHALTNKLFGASIIKLCFGLRVVDKNGEQINFRKTFVRYGLKAGMITIPLMLSSAIDGSSLFGKLFIVCVFNISILFGRHQAPHDFVYNSLVVNKDSRITSRVKILMIITILVLIVWQFFMQKGVKVSEILSSNILNSKSTWYITHSINTPLLDSFIIDGNDGNIVDGGFDSGGDLITKRLKVSTSEDMSFVELQFSSAGFGTKNLTVFEFNIEVLDENGNVIEDAGTTTLINHGVSQVEALEISDFELGLDNDRHLIGEGLDMPGYVTFRTVYDYNFFTHSVRMYSIRINSTYAVDGTRQALNETYYLRSE